MLGYALLWSYGLRLQTGHAAFECWSQNVNATPFKITGTRVKKIVCLIGGSWLDTLLSMKITWKVI